MSTVTAGWATWGFTCREGAHRDARSTASVQAKLVLVPVRDGAPGELPARAHRPATGPGGEFNRGVITGPKSRRAVGVVVVDG